MNAGVTHVEAVSDGCRRGFEAGGRDAHGRWARRRTDIDRLVREHVPKGQVMETVYREIKRLLKEGRVPVRTSIEAVELVLEDLYEERAKRSLTFSENQADIFGEDEGE